MRHTQHYYYHSGNYSGSCMEFKYWYGLKYSVKHQLLANVWRVYISVIYKILKVYKHTECSQYIKHELLFPSVLYGSLRTLEKFGKL